MSLSMVRAQNLKFAESFDVVKKHFMREGFYSTAITECVYDLITYYFAPIILKLKLSLNDISLIRIALVISCVLFTIFGGLEGWRIGFLLFFIANILDYVDGRVARATSKGTYFGHFIDGLIDIASETMIRFALAWGIYHQFGFTPLFWLGILSMMLTSFHIFLYDRYSAFARWISSTNNMNISPVLQRKGLLKPQNVMWDLEWLSLFFSLAFFVQAIWIYFILSLIHQVFFITYIINGAHDNMRVPNEAH